MKKKIIFFLLCCVPLYSAEAITQVFDRGITLERVKDQDGFLQVPWSLDIDEEGQTLVADVLARKIFVWDAKGNYKTSFGQEGRGPGEFMFTGRGSGGYQAYVASSGDKIYVYDGSERKLNIFNRQFQFQTSSRINLGGRTEAFFVTGSGEIIIFQKNYNSEIPTTEIGFYSEEGELKRRILQEEDHSFSRITSGGKLQNVVYHAYSPTLFLHYDRGNDEMLIGNTGKPYIETFNGDGRLSGSIPLLISPKEITNDDRREYQEQFWLKDSTFLKVDFPEQKSYYDKALPLGTQHLFLYYQSPVEKRIEGWLINRKGQKVGKLVQFTCGEGGGLFGARGRIMVVRIGKDDEYCIQELSLP